MPALSSTTPRPYSLPPRRVTSNGGDVQAAALRHLDVEQHEVRLESLDRLGGFAAVAGGSNHLDVADLGQQGRQPLERSGFVVDEQETHQAAAFERMGVTVAARCNGRRTMARKPRASGAACRTPRGP